MTHHCFLFLAQQETGEMPGLCQLQPPQTQHHPWCRRQGKTVLPGRSTNKIYFTYHNSTSMTVAKPPPVGKSYCPQLQELAHQDFFQQYLFGITLVSLYIQSRMIVPPGWAPLQSKQSVKSLIE